MYLFIVCILPRILLPLGFPGGSAGKESTCNKRDLGLIPGLGRSPEEGNSYPLQYSGQENSMDCTFHGVSKSQTQLSHFPRTPFIKNILAKNGKCPASNLLFLLSQSQCCQQFWPIYLEFCIFLFRHLERVITHLYFYLYLYPHISSYQTETHYKYWPATVFFYTHYIMSTVQLENMISLHLFHGCIPFQTTD